MAQLFTNGARALLTSGITSTANSLTIEAGKADLFPVANVGSGSLPSVNNWFKAVLQDSLGNIEIVYVRTRTSGSGVFSNVLRGQEGTTARAYSAGAVVGLRLTAADVNSVIDFVSKNNAFTGNNSFAGTSTFFGGSTFSGATAFSGAASFSSAVGFSGGVTVSSLLQTTNERMCVVNAASAMYEMHIPGVVGRGLYVAPDGVTRLSTTNGSGSATNALWAVDAAGNFTALSNVTAYSDERLKKDWSDLPHDFIERLASVKHGTYTRTDSGERQAGVSGQDFKELLQEVVSEGDKGFLSVAYGNAALVSAIQLALRVVEIDSRLTKLEGN